MIDIDGIESRVGTQAALPPLPTEMNKYRSKLPSVQDISLVYIVVPADSYKYPDLNGGAHAAGCDAATVTSRGTVTVEIRGTS